MSARHVPCAQIVFDGKTTAATLSIAAAGAVVLISVAGTAGSGAAAGAVSFVRLTLTLSSTRNIRKY